ncbi:ras-related protein Rab-7L1 isoform X2 [Bemisia tabaci]|uniref:ras-related protein Rab-7L1 isoform X2 n=1 Tax=Bemisia tabaci TaxID=7038 RepID=UPI003B27F220
MSDNKRRSLVFWPRVDHSDSSSDTEWEDAPLQQLSDKGDSTPLGEGSDPESDAQFRLMAERKTVIVPEKLYKVIIIGDPTVGKTSYVQRYVQNSFKKDYKGTVGVDFALKVLQWSDHQTLKLQLWDIAGQERFTQMTRVYYKDAHGCVIMFDLTNKNSFINTLKWKNDVDEKCQLSNGNPIPCMLLANKVYGGYDDEAGKKRWSNCKR